MKQFSCKLMSNEVVDLEDVVCGEVCFYAHTMLRAVLYEEYLEKVGSSKNLGDTENIKFRLFSEGNFSHLTVSHKWFVWTINHKYVHIGDLTGEYK